MLHIVLKKSLYKRIIKLNYNLRWNNLKVQFL